VDLEDIEALELNKRAPGWGKRAPGWGKRAPGWGKRAPGWGKRSSGLEVSVCEALKEELDFFVGKTVEVSINDTCIVRASMNIRQNMYVMSGWLR
jgi:hypothetical protein